MSVIFSTRVSVNKNIYDYDELDLIPLTCVFAAITSITKCQNQQRLIDFISFVADG